MKRRLNPCRSNKIKSFIRATFRLLARCVSASGAMEGRRLTMLCGGEGEKEGGGLREVVRR